MLKISILNQICFIMLVTLSSCILMKSNYKLEEKCNIMNNPFYNQIQSTFKFYHIKNTIQTLIWKNVLIYTIKETVQYLTNNAHMKQLYKILENTWIQNIYFYEVIKVLNLKDTALIEFESTDYMELYFLQSLNIQCDKMKPYIKKCQLYQIKQVLESNNSNDIDLDDLGLKNNYYCIVSGMNEYYNMTNNNENIFDYSVYMPTIKLFLMTYLEYIKHLKMVLTVNRRLLLTHYMNEISLNQIPSEISRECFKYILRNQIYIDVENLINSLDSKINEIK